MTSTPISYIHYTLIYYIPYATFIVAKPKLQASGEMVHYCNGRPVAADYNGGSKVIHSHKNCTEW